MAQQTRGTLYVVALPIGNPKDITSRALEILSKVDVVAAEDTRTFNELAKQLQIAPSKVVAHHEHNEEESAKGLLALLLGGQTVAITTDAGTPNLSDPGYRLLREAFENGVRVVPLPGASALTTAVSAAPIGGRKLFFGGFA
ncbi:MAG TPA: SAM-dependent methyltransferase, partial [Bdellovibrionales bacterium]|nr:SAM-dependent methyltransferase [Bdellovibrionales bacterium]